MPGLGSTHARIPLTCDASLGYTLMIQMNDINDSSGLNSELFLPVTTAIEGTGMTSSALVYYAKDLPTSIIS